MKKILYLMSIDWYWIKQRPQILAEMLEQDFEVTVVYQRDIWAGLKLRKENDELKESRSVYLLPFRDKSKIMHFMQKLLYKVAISRQDKYDYIWIGEPRIFEYISKNSKQKIIYDCMDDYENLCGDIRIKDKIINSHRRLMQRADICFVSSEKLLQKNNRYNPILIKNGYIGKEIYPPQKESSKLKRHIGYFGTIASWIDWKMIMYVIEKQPNIIFHFWGPVADKNHPTHERLIFEGICEHDKLGIVTKDIDCFIMPFIVNDAIKAVNPVKLYEYISLGKPIISSYYEELDDFKDFVLFYKDEESFLKAIDELELNKYKANYGSEEQEEFLDKNSWKQRYKEIKCNLGE